MIPSTLSMCPFSFVSHILFFEAWSVVRDSRKSQQKMAKNTADFCENRKNHGKITAQAWHQVTGPKTIIQSTKLNI